MKSFTKERTYLYTLKFVNTVNTESLRILEITKLYKQCGQPSRKQLIRLLKNAGTTNSDYFKAAEELTIACPSYKGTYQDQW